MTAKWILPLIALLSFIALLSLFGCTREDDKLSTPQTVFDEEIPDPRSDDQKLTDFLVKLERKYKREERNNTIDLHFTENGPRHVKIRLSYDRLADPTTVSSIADAAMDLAKRLKREDKSVRDLDITFDREIIRREE